MTNLNKSMSYEIKVGDAEKVSTHVMPCKISTEGSINSRQYFFVNRQQDDSIKEFDLVVNSESTKDIRNEPSLKDTKSLEQPDTNLLMSDSDELYITYFRGRRLVGQKLDFEDKYEGLVLPPSSSATTKEINYKCEMIGEDQEDESHMDIKDWGVAYKFKDMYVWDQDTAPDTTMNPWISSIQEWMSFSEMMHNLED
ncbi:ribonuclease H2, subunit C [Dipodascopsis uninucleata]